MTAPRTAAKLVIYGSCVARDSVEYLSAGRATVVEYVARQSLVSAFSPAGEPSFDLKGLDSPFQRRVLKHDARSKLLPLLRKHATSTDLLLWDLFDERLGYYVHDDGHVTTNSVELIRAEREGQAEPKGRLIEFGTAEHLERFRGHLLEFRRALAERDLLGRLVLIAPDWAWRATTGRHTPSSFGLSARRANLLVAPYLSAVEHVVRPGVIIRPPANLTLADPDHRWGLAPFHYQPAVYEYIALALEQILAAGSVTEEIARRSMAGEGVLPPCVRWRTRISSWAAR